MQAISLHDTLTATPDDELTLTCSLPDLAGPENLAWRAGALLRRETGTQAGAQLALEKCIPVAAGLGGGSADAAAALRALNELWSLDLQPERLVALAAELGSDVPFFLVPSGCALAEGRGERLTPLPPLPTRWIVLAKPAVPIAAGAAYREFARKPAYSDGSRTSAWLAAARATGNVPQPFNHLEPAALRVAPDACAARDALSAAGAEHPVMSGSGSTYFALFDSQEAAGAVAGRLGGGELEIHVAQFAAPDVVATPG